jgi:hypothetical protein
MNACGLIGASCFFPRDSAKFHLGVGSRVKGRRTIPPAASPIMTSIATARRFQDLLIPDAAPAPYEYSTLFASDGWLARGRAKRRFKLLQKLDSKLREILKPDERVFFVTAGSTVSFAEHFFMGWAAYYLNRRALVFTTERVLLVQIDSRKRPRELVSQLRYDQIASIKSSWTGICKVELHGGMKYKFQGVPKAEQKFLSEFLVDIVKPVRGAATDAVNHIENLCPTCFVLVAEFPPACPACQAPFKSAKKAALLSLAFPGLGDFYLGHRGFAAVELLGSALLWFVLIISPLMSGELVDDETGARTRPESAYWLTVVLFIAVAHAVDCMMTQHFAKKGHHPA